MIGFLIPLVMKLGIPQRFAKPVATGALIVAGAVLLIIAFNLWLGGEKRAAVQNDRARSRAAAAEIARKADQQGNAAAQGTVGTIEAGNAAAAEAAAGSDDPLKAGLDQLREGRP